MNVIRMNTEHRYTTSRDYEKLWELVQETPVICIVYAITDKPIRDVASSISSGDTVNIGSRGLSYIYAWTREDFISQCQDVNLEYIMPGGRP